MREMLMVALLLPACAGRDVKPEPTAESVAAVPQDNGSGDALLTQAEKDTRVRKEQEAVMYRRHMAFARQHHRAGGLEEALTEVRKALTYRPTSEEAQRLVSQILFEQGNRQGAVSTLMDDQVESYSVRLEQRKVSARSLIGEAERFVAAGDYKRARNAYERAVFVATSDHRIRHDDLARLAYEAGGRLKDLDDIEAKARAERERKDIEDALERIEKHR